MISKDTYIERSPNAFSEKIGNEKVVLLPDSMKVYRLGTTASMVWNYIESKHTLEEIILLIQNELGIDPVDFEHEILHFVDQLMSLGLSQVVAD